MIGPGWAATFVDPEEAQAALRALADAGVVGEVRQREEAFPMTIAKYEPAFGVTVRPQDLPRAREILKTTGLLPVSIAGFRREEDSALAIATLESRGLKPRLTTLVLDEIPPEFREEMEPYIVEVPAGQEGPSMEALEAAGFRVCEACGAMVLPGGARACSACGEAVPA